MINNLQQMSPAELLLWGFGITAPEHIDLEAIANAKGAEVVYRPLEGCEARLVARGDMAIISVNSNCGEGRQRFSLAHELAHWICDRKSGVILCAKDDIGPQNAEARSIEAHANAYASQLILPNYLIDPWLQGRRISLETASQLGKEFNSSLSAAAIKVVKRAAARVCLACHSKTRLTWHQRSASFPYDFFVQSELHYETDAFEMAFGSTGGMTKAIREPASRWLSGHDVFRIEAATQSVKLPDSTILTMINLSP